MKIYTQKIQCSNEHLKFIIYYEELKNIQFANHGGLNTEGLGEEELKELQRQIDFIKKMKNKKEK